MNNLRPTTATIIRLRQREADFAIYRHMHNIHEFTARVARHVFSNRNKAVYFGIRTPPRTNDMAQMLDDINRALAAKP